MFWLHLKTLLRELLLPPASPLLLGLLGLLLWQRRARLARTLVALSLGSLWLLSMPSMGAALSRLVEHYPALDLSQAGSAQAIVILGGGGQRALAPEYGGAAAAPELLERLAYGAYIARRTDLPILVTGFGIEAVAMRQTLRRNFDLDPRWVDDHAYDTFENARNSTAILRRDGITRIILVTRASHMWRSVHEFSAAGMQVVPAPAGMYVPQYMGVLEYVPSTDGLRQSYEASYELVGEAVRLLLAATHLRRQDVTPPQDAAAAAASSRHVP